MALSATVDHSHPPLAGAPGIVVLQRALLWLIGAGGAIVFIEPSPYELSTLAAMVIFFASGLRLRMQFIPLLILLFLVNIGYTICAAYMMDQKPIINWIMTSWYMAVTVMFFAMVFSEDTAARLDLLRRGLRWHRLLRRRLQAERRLGRGLRPAGRGDERQHRQREPARRKQFEGMNASIGHVAKRSPLAAARPA